jgi:hypothetical protein
MKEEITTKRVTQQGEGYSKEDREIIVNSLEPYLKANFSRNKACRIIGLVPQTLSLWLKADNALLMKVNSWENSVSLKAINNIREKIEGEEPDIETSKWWAERRLKKEFSTRIEQGFDDEIVERIKVEIITKSDDIKHTSDTDISEDSTE